MSEQELTPWFPADIKPVHVGWYNVGVHCLGFFHESGSNWWWDGESWLAYPHAGKPSIRQDRKWRGLVSRSEKS
jgi:hypothetical protein